MHQVHGYNTRSRDLLRPPLAKTTKCQGSFRINGARTCIQHSTGKHQANGDAQ